MGACNFTHVIKGKSAERAFWDKVEQAIIEEGNGGYTGTIAEKTGFKMMRLPQDWVQVDPIKDALRYVQKLEEDDAFPFNDKWGPAGMIDLGDETYVVFGSASS